MNGNQVTALRAMSMFFRYLAGEYKTLPTAGEAYTVSDDPGSQAGGIPLN
jgi:hypothetical protein